MIRVLVVGSVLLIAQAVPALAETIYLVCQARNDHDRPFVITIDLKNKTAFYKTESDHSATGQVDISDAKFAIHMPMHGYAGIDHTEIEIDRVTGVSSWRNCNPSQCYGALFAGCHKGSPIL